MTVQPDPVALPRPGRQTHATVLRDLLDSLSGPSPDVTAAVNAERSPFDPPPSWPLAALTTRNPADPALAVLDAWAVVADVLSFYTQRIAAEGYLASATEPGSLESLAATTGYRPRPALAASGHLALLLEQVAGADQDVVVPSGTTVQSLPGPGELPQVFETSANITGRAAWNVLHPRRSLPPVLDAESTSVWVQGTTPRVQPGDLVLVVPPTGSRVARRITAVTPDRAAQRTLLTLQPWTSAAPPPAELTPPVAAQTPLPEQTTDLSDVVTALKKPPPPPPNPAALRRNLDDLLAAASDLRPRLVAALRPELAETLPAALSRLAARRTPARLVAFRGTAQLFGASAPPRPVYGDREGHLSGFDDWDRTTGMSFPVVALSLDSRVTSIAPGSPVVLTAPQQEPFVTEVVSTEVVAEFGYGRAGQVTRLTVADPWSPPAGTTLTGLRSVAVHLLAEDLQLADVPDVPDVGDDTGQVGTTIALDGLHSGLASGRLVIVHGERTDVPGVTGLQAAELAMIAEVTYAAADPTDTLHTTLQLAGPLAYTYRPGSVEIYGNVVAVTAGAGRDDVLGVGGAGRSSFPLRQSPLTYLPGPHGGPESTLRVYVDGVAWHEVDSLSELGPDDAAFLVVENASGASSVFFGDGRNGAALPTGATVTASYRTGAGSAGNVRAGQLSQLLSRPLGLRDVRSPLPASGGADREDPGSIRTNAATAILAGGRLVSVRDYEDFARAYPGIGKACARRMSNGAQDVVFVTVTGPDAEPVENDSSLLIALRAALREQGDPGLPVVVAPPVLTLLVIALQLRLRAGFQWAATETRARATLAARFSFAAQELGADVLLGDVLLAAQAVAGVAEVHVTTLCGLSEPIPAHSADLGASRQLRVTAGQPRLEAGRLVPAGLVVFSPAVADTLVLQEAPP